MTEEITLEEFWKLYGGGRASKSSKKPKAQKREAVDLIPLMMSAGIPTPVAELKFCATRRWRFDYAWPKEKIALEVDGGTFGSPVRCNNCHQSVTRLVNGRNVLVREGGRHNTGSGFEADCEKLNEAAILGWRVLRVTTAMVDDDRVLLILQRMFDEEK